MMMAKEKKLFFMEKVGIVRLNLSIAHFLTLFGKHLAYFSISNFLIRNVFLMYFSSSSTFLARTVEKSNCAYIFTLMNNQIRYV